MSVPLESLATCFQGLLPAQLFTCSSDGVPNAAYLSHVEYVDAEHVALSFQFFNKSRRNIAENPKAEVMVIDPDTGQGWLLLLHYVRSETAGALFDRMALRIEAIASYSGLKGIFKLRAADVYRVVSIAKAPEETGIAAPLRLESASDIVFTVDALHDLMARLDGVDSLEGLMDAILAGADACFGFRHSMILLPTEQEGVLVTVATRGYPANGVGSEMRFGEGVGGLVAEARSPIRISGLLRGMLYALAMHGRASESDIVRKTRQIPVPGLENPDSQLGVPLLVRGELVGVLCLESERPYRFHETDKACVDLLGRCLAFLIHHLQWQERASDAVADAAAPADASVAPPSPTPDAQVMHFVYHVEDACMLIDGEYLIRGLPATILRRLLRIRESTGRFEFTNRELRLDKSLQLPAWKDNLESRLILLRRRLEQKCPALRLVARGRGRFALDTDAVIVLDEQ